PPPDVEINKHVSKPESFLGMIVASAEDTPLAGSPGSNTAVRTRCKALRAQPDQQWFGLGPRKWASKLAVNDLGWNPGEISRKSPALQGWGSNLLSHCPLTQCFWWLVAQDVHRQPALARS